MVAEHTRREESVNPNVSLVWTVNLLCVVGACVGVAALFLGWILEPPTMVGPWDILHEPTILYMVVNHYLYYGAAAMFLLGTLIALVSPIGGFPQLASLMVFAYGIVESGNRRTHTDGIDDQQSVFIGMFLGVVSCSLILVSLFSPIGTGNLRRPHSKNIRLVERVLTVSLSMRREEGV